MKIFSKTPYTCYHSNGDMHKGFIYDILGFQVWETKTEETKARPPKHFSSNKLRWKYPKKTFK